jgi:hypothetical protein
MLGTTHNQSRLTPWNRILKWGKRYKGILIDIAFWQASSIIYLGRRYVLTKVWPSKIAVYLISVSNCRDCHHRDFCYYCHTRRSYSIFSSKPYRLTDCKLRVSVLGNPICEGHGSNQIQATVVDTSSNPSLINSSVCYLWYVSLMTRSRRDRMLPLPVHVWTIIACSSLTELIRFDLPGDPFVQPWM